MNEKMKRFGTLWIILLMGLFHSGELAAQTVNAIKVVGNHAPPYRIIEGNSFSGIYFDAMKEIGKRIDITIVFKEKPFKRALKLMEYGRADVMLGPNRNPEREAYMVYTEATVGRANKAFYVHPESPLITQYDDLKGKRIVTHRGKKYFDKFDNDGSLEKIVANSYAQAIFMISKRRGDAVIMPENGGDYLLMESNIFLIKSPFIVEGKQSYLTISRKSPVIELQTKIEEAMSEIYSDGTMDKILNQYSFEK